MNLTSCIVIWTVRLLRRKSIKLFASLLISFLLGPVVINWLRRSQPNGQPIREDEVFPLLWQNPTPAAEA